MPSPFKMCVKFVKAKAMLMLDVMDIIEVHMLWIQSLDMVMLSWCDMVFDQIASWNFHHSCTLGEPLDEYECILMFHFCKID